MQKENELLIQEVIHSYTLPLYKGALSLGFDEKGFWAKPPQSPEDFAMNAEIMDHIRVCMEKLPLTQRMAFCLKEVDDQGSSDICKILEVTTTNLGVLLYRARNKLRECIERRANR